jgi:uncharacterized protein YajQ (UPF0234 family)
MPSFDVLSKVPWHEVDNATQLAQREVQTRFDFKGSGAEIERTKEGFVLRAGSEEKLKSALDVLKDKLVRRKVSLKHLDAGKIEPATKGTYRMPVGVKEGIDIDHAKQLVKWIKEEKSLKVTASIIDEAVRVSGKKKDDLQAAMQLIRGREFDLELTFGNFRE